MTNDALLKTGLDLKNISAYIAPAFSIAVLGMIESLLCGASASKMKGEKIDLQRELVAQGIGNAVIPLFGGVPTAAVIARTSVGIKTLFLTGGGCGDGRPLMVAIFALFPFDSFASAANTVE